MTTITDTLSPIGIPSGTWRIDRARTRVGFAVKTLGVSTVRGEFRRFDGALEIGADLANTRAYGRVDAGSIDTNQARRDTHLRSPAFLSTERHPELTLRSKTIEPVEDGTFQVVGELSINGVTNEVELAAKRRAIETGPEGETRLDLEVTGEVSRKAFAMKFDGALGRALVADEVKIDIDVEAIREA